MPQYIKFKAQKIGHRTEIKDLIDGFNAEEVEYYNECIYWCHKMFQERVCDKVKIVSFVPPTVFK